MQDIISGCYGAEGELREKLSGKRTEIGRILWKVADDKDVTSPPKKQLLI